MTVSFALAAWAAPKNMVLRAEGPLWAGSVVTRGLARTGSSTRAPQLKQKRWPGLRGARHCPQAAGADAGADADADADGDAPCEVSCRESSETTVPHRTQMDAPMGLNALQESHTSPTSMFTASLPSPKCIVKIVAW